jgi:hypothetical protein
MATWQNIFKQFLGNFFMHFQICVFSLMIQTKTSILLFYVTITQDMRSTALFVKQNFSKYINPDWECIWLLAPVFSPPYFGFCPLLGRALPRTVLPWSLYQNLQLPCARVWVCLLMCVYVGARLWGFHRSHILHCLLNSRFPHSAPSNFMLDS